MSKRGCLLKTDAHIVAVRHAGDPVPSLPPLWRKSVPKHITIGKATFNPLTNHLISRLSRQIDVEADPRVW